MYKISFGGVFPRSGFRRGTISRPDVRGEVFLAPRTATLARRRARKLSSEHTHSNLRLFGGRYGLALPVRLSSGRRAHALAGGRQRAARALGRPPRDGLAYLVRGRDARPLRLHRGHAAAGAA